MKRLLIIIALVICFHGLAQRKPKIKGNRNVVESLESLPAFNKIELNDDLDITLRNSNEYGYQITADENLINVFRFKVADSILMISSFYKVTSKKKLNIVVDCGELISVYLREGKIESESNFTTDVFTVQQTGTSRLMMNINAGIVDVNMEGISSGELNLQTDSLHINLKDRSDVRIYSLNSSTSIDMVQNASAIIEGATELLSANLINDASLKAEKFEAVNVRLNLQESPRAEIFARDHLDLSSQGASQTFLYGNPKITITEFLNKSELHKEE